MAAGREKKPFGWEVDVSCLVTIIREEVRTYHYRGCTRRAAERKAMLRPGAKRVVEVRPVREDTWLSFYGMGRM